MLLHIAMLGAWGRESGKEGQDTAILLHICIHSEAHRANARFNLCIRKGANLARQAVEYCRAAAYRDAGGLRAQIW